MNISLLCNESSLLILHEPVSIAHRLPKKIWVIVILIKFKIHGSSVLYFNHLFLLKYGGDKALKDISI